MPHRFVDRNIQKPTTSFWKRQPTTSCKFLEDSYVWFSWKAIYTWTLYSTKATLYYTTFLVDSLWFCFNLNRNYQELTYRTLPHFNMASMHVGMFVSCLIYLSVYLSIYLSRVPFSNLSFFRPIFLSFSRSLSLSLFLDSSNSDASWWIVGLKIVKWHNMMCYTFFKLWFQLQLIQNGNNKLGHLPQIGVKLTQVWNQHTFNVTYKFPCLPKHPDLTWLVLNGSPRSSWPLVITSSDLHQILLGKSSSSWVVISNWWISPSSDFPV